MTAKLWLLWTIALPLCVTQSFAQWTQVTNIASDNVMALAIKPNGDIFYGTSNDGAYRSTDNGASWTLSLGQLYSVYQVFSLAFDPSGFVYAGTYAEGLLRSTNNGDSWNFLSSDTPPNNMPMGDVYAVATNSSGTIFASYLGSIYRSTDGGSSWTMVRSGSSGTNGLRSIVCLGADSAYACGTTDYLYYSTNGGTTWTWHGSSDGLNNAPYTIVSSPGNLLFIGTQGGVGVFKSTDGGVTWTAANSGLTNKTVNTLSVNGAGIIYAGTKGGVFISSDHGGNWTAYNGGLTPTDIRSIAFDPYGNVYAGGYNSSGTGGLWRSVVPLPVEIISFTASAQRGVVILRWNTATEVNNYGFEIEKRLLGAGEWTPLGFVPGCGTTVREQTYFFNDSTAVGGKWSYRLKQIDLDGTIHYIDAAPIDVPLYDAKAPLPNSFAISQNYPNPFNPRTTILYEVPEVWTQGSTDGCITLTVFDLLGNEVATLVNEQKGAGRYSVQFDASGLASGVYFYRLQAADLIQTKRFVVLR